MRWSRMVRRCVLLLLLLLSILTLVPEDSYSDCPDPSRDLLVWIDPSAAQLPSIQDTYSINSVTWHSQSIQSALSDAGVEQIAQAFPEFFSGDSVLVRQGGEVIPLNRYREVFRMRFTAGRDLDAAVTALQEVPGVFFVQKLPSVVFASAYANDPLFRSGSQWQLYNYGQAGLAGRDIKATTAWSISTGAASATVSILDGGVDSIPTPGDTVLDLVGRLAPGSDAGWNSDGGAQAGHGFKVAGVIAARANNNIGTAGLAWDSPLLSLNISMDPCKKSQNIVDKLRAAGNLGAKVINNSYILDCQGSPVRDLAVGAEIAAQYNAGRLIVAGMGNDNNNVTQYPAGYGTSDPDRQPEKGNGWGVIAVGSVDGSDSRSSFSPTGAHLDVVAPGEGVWTASALSTTSPQSPPAISDDAALVAGDLRRSS